MASTPERLSGERPPPAEVGDAQSGAAAVVARGRDRVLGGGMRTPQHVGAAAGCGGDPWDTALGDAAPPSLRAGAGPGRRQPRSRGAALDARGTVERRGAGTGRVEHRERRAPRVRGATSDPECWTRWLGTTRYYGWYANRPRGMWRRAEPAPAEAPPAIAPAPRLVPTEASRRWAALLQHINEVHPLACPSCHAVMRIIAFITQASVINQILTHLRTRVSATAPGGARSPPSHRCLHEVPAGTARPSGTTARTARPRGTGRADAPWSVLGPSASRRVLDRPRFNYLSSLGVGGEPPGDLLHEGTR